MIGGQGVQRLHSIERYPGGILSVRHRNTICSHEHFLSRYP